MKTDHTATHDPNKRLFGIIFGAISLLLIPLVLQLTIGTGIDGQGFNWQIDDFVVFGLLLFVTGLLIELVMRKIKRTSKRIIICGVVLLMFLLIWADLAVGIFNIPGFSGS
jgi:hypothetical protein